MNCHKIQYKPKQHISSKCCFSAWLPTWSEHPLLDILQRNVLCFIWIVGGATQLQCLVRRRGARRKEGKKRNRVEHGERETWEICSRKRNAALHPGRPPSHLIPSLRAARSRRLQKPPPKRLVIIPSMLNTLESKRLQHELKQAPEFLQCFVG